MKTVFFLLFFVPLSAIAFDDNPYTTFDASKRMTTNTQVDWRVVSDANTTCQQESRKRGFGGFPYHVEACTFWDENHGGAPSCTIFTNRITNMHQLGHEVRHCFQGAYH